MTRTIPLNLVRYALHAQRRRRIRLASLAPRYGIAATTCRPRCSWIDHHHGRAFAGHAH